MEKSKIKDDKYTKYNTSLTNILIILIFLILSLQSVTAQSGGGMVKCYISSTNDSTIQDKEIDCAEAYELQRIEKLKQEQLLLEQEERLNQIRERIHNNIDEMRENLKIIKLNITLTGIFLFLTICLLLYEFYKDYKNKK